MPELRTNRAHHAKHGTSAGLSRAERAAQRRAASPHSLIAVRNAMGLTQPEFARLLGISVRSLAASEAAQRPLRLSVQRRVAEISRLRAALARVIRAEPLRAWLHVPNPAFGQLKPIELVERGQIDRLWRMIFYLESGVAS